MTPRKTQLIWTEVILANHFRFKDLDINSNFGMQKSYNPWDRKILFCGVKENR